MPEDKPILATADEKGLSAAAEPAGTSLGRAPIRKRNGEWLEPRDRCTVKHEGNGATRPLDPTGIGVEDVTVKLCLAARFPEKPTTAIEPAHENDRHGDPDGVQR